MSFWLHHTGELGDLSSPLCVEKGRLACCGITDCPGRQPEKQQGQKELRI